LFSGKSALPAFATYNPNTLTTQFARVITEYINVTVIRIRLAVEFSVVFAREKLQVVACEVPPCLEIVIDELFEDVFLQDARLVRTLLALMGTAI